ncbi:hypothetical protein [Acidisphaera sp. S103]|uniref:hypothetical protein n=1 Tax=Acidisphaera sp. S103 TaxID=1747223 RepID=UPI00131B5752|nr:hypothetical protein [Acidisphaera sp. S103]
MKIIKGAAWFSGAVILALIVIAGVVLFLGPALNAGCENTPISAAVSPDRLWSAAVVEAVCGDGALTTTVVDTVMLVPVNRSVAEGKAVFRVDTGGHVDERPSVKWVEPRTLLIEAFTSPYAQSVVTSYQGVTIRQAPRIAR